MSLIITRATLDDCEELLEHQYNAFIPYIHKYGDFESNPCHMDLDRMRFNINYFMGKYYKIILDDKIIGGLFIFKLDDDQMKIAQFYIDEEYRSQGIGSKVLEFVYNDNPDIKYWFSDTIAYEDSLVKFYVNKGFSILDFDEEESLKFVIFKKTIK